MELKPTFAWGAEREFAIRVEAPVDTFHPGDTTAPVVSGFASLTTRTRWRRRARS
jgi:hypothetical protein